MISGAGLCWQHVGGVGSTTTTTTTVRKFTYLCYRMSDGGGYEAAVTSRTICGLGKIRECGELLYGRRLPPKLKGAVYKRYIRPANLHGSEAGC